VDRRTERVGQETAKSCSTPQTAAAAIINVTPGPRRTGTTFDSR
jgi:hypothetical protein